MKKVKRSAVSATQAARNFGALIDRVRESASVYDVESHGQIVAEIHPAARRVTVQDVANFFRTVDRAPAEWLDSVEAVRAEARQQPAEPTPRLSGRGGRQPRPRS